MAVECRERCRVGGRESEADMFGTVDVQSAPLTRTDRYESVATTPNQNGKFRVVTAGSFRIFALPVLFDQIINNSALRDLHAIRPERQPLRSTLLQIMA